MTISEPFFSADCHYSLHTSDGRIITPAAGQILVIGQGEDAGLRLSNPGPYLDFPVAKIVVTDDGWCLVRLSRFVGVDVNGSPVRYIHRLEDRDFIDFPGLSPSVRFRVSDGAQPPQTIVHQGVSRRGIALTVVALVFLLFSAGWWLLRMNARDSLDNDMISLAERSLYRLEVDSLLLFEGDSLREVYAYPIPPAGTAFLTADSLLVTARHCVEPWINAIDAPDIPDLPANDNPAVRLALSAETSNQLAPEDEAPMRLVSSIRLTDSRGRVLRIRSDRFRIDRSRDEIVELGDYDRDLYWRNIQARYGRDDMMLGDAVSCRMNRPGSIRLLSDTAAFATALRPRRSLTFMGFPVTQGHDLSAEVETDRLRQPILALPDDSARFSMLSHGGRLAPGYSGGPVLVLDSDAPLGFAAVGVISVLDRTNGHRSYSVPSTAIPRK